MSKKVREKSSESHNHKNRVRESPGNATITNRGGWGGGEGRGFEALLQPTNFSLGPDATLNHN